MNPLEPADTAGGRAPLLHYVGLDPIDHQGHALSPRIAVS